MIYFSLFLLCLFVFTPDLTSFTYLRILLYVDHQATIVKSDDLRYRSDCVKSLPEVGRQRLRFRLIVLTPRYSDTRERDENSAFLSFQLKVQTECE